MALLTHDMAVNNADGQKYRTRAHMQLKPRGEPPTTPAGVSVHNLRVLKKAPTVGHVPTTHAQSGASAASSASRQQRKYQRKSKRFLWPDDLHRLFVAAIFDVGLKNASPKGLLTIMLSSGATSDLTTEHLKSHLQKYRLNYERSRLEFLEYFDQSARRSLKRRRKTSRSSDQQGFSFVFPISVQSGSSMEDADMTSESENGSDEEQVGDDNGHEDEEEATADEEQRDAAASPSPRDLVAVNRSTHRPCVTPVHSTPRGRPTKRRHTSPREALQQARAAATTAPTSLAPPSITTQSSSATAIQPKVEAPAGSAMRYPSPIKMVNGTTMQDPQWNLLNSLVASNVAPVSGHAAAINALTFGTNPSITNARTSGSTSGRPSMTGAASTTAIQPKTMVTKTGVDPYAAVLVPAPSPDLQMQIHLAMQAQMNLHRQMLTRKVEVSQQLLSYQQPKSPAQPAAVKAHHTIPRPLESESAQSLALDGDTMGMSLGEIFSTTDGVSSATTTTRLDQSSGEASVDATPSMFVGDDGNDVTLPPGLQLDAIKVDDNVALDLARWDRMDFEMDLDDDDLFGFLKT